MAGKGHTREARAEVKVREGMESHERLSPSTGTQQLVSVAPSAAGHSLNSFQWSAIKGRPVDEERGREGEGERVRVREGEGGRRGAKEQRLKGKGKGVEGIDFFKTRD